MQQNIYIMKGGTVMVSKNSNKQNMKAILTGLPEDVSIDRVVEHPHSLELCVSWDEPSVGKRFCNTAASRKTPAHIKLYDTFQLVRRVPLLLSTSLGIVSKTVVNPFTPNPNGL